MKLQTKKLKRKPQKIKRKMNNRIEIPTRPKRNFVSDIYERMNMRIYINTSELW